jgi:hypothetical protein
LDQALVLTFSEGSGFTGECSAELHLHGSTAVTRAVLSALSRLPGLRPADPGEFTRRALENDRLDLAQVEGLADLIEAETEIQRKQALRVLSGAIGQRADVWRAKLIRAAALLEATIDFADEDVPVDVAPEVLEILCALLTDFRAESAGARIAERVRDGFVHDRLCGQIAADHQEHLHSHACVVEEPLRELRPRSGHDLGHRSVGREVVPHDELCSHNFEHIDSKGAFKQMNPFQDRFSRLA